MTLAGDGYAILGRIADGAAVREVRSTLAASPDPVISRSPASCSSMRQYALGAP